MTGLKEAHLLKMNDLCDYMEAENASLNVNDITSSDADMSEDDELNEWAELSRSMQLL